MTAVSFGNVSRVFVDERMSHEQQDEAQAREQVCDAIHEAVARGDTSFFVTNNFALRRFPEQIRNLKGTLQVLHIDNNYEMRTLPPAIGELSSLRWLNVSYNKLTELPIEIGRLQKLERLHVNNNHIEALPLELWALRNLEELRCESNRILALPTGVLMMRNLREAMADNNPLLTPADVDGADLYDVFPKLQGGDCASCRVRFRDYVVSCTFHAICGGAPTPIVHYCCGENCMKQLMGRLAAMAEESAALSPAASPTKGV